MDVAVARVNISPYKLPVLLDGFEFRFPAWPQLPEREITKVHDPIYLNGIAFRTDQIEYFVLVFDLLEFRGNAIEKIYGALESENIIRSQILITCTHTHFAPAASPISFLWQNGSSYLEFLIPKIVELIYRLRDNYVTDCTLNFFSGTSFIPKERYGFQFPDDSLSVISIIDKERRYVAIVFCIATHPVNFQNLCQISADYPGKARDLLLDRFMNEEICLPGFLPIFLQGAAGSSDPRFSWDVAGKKLAEEVWDLHLSNSYKELSKDFEQIIEPFEIECEDLRTQMELGECINKFPWPITILKFPPNFLLFGLCGDVAAEISKDIRELCANKGYTALIIGYSGDAYTYIVADTVERYSHPFVRGMLKWVNLSGPILKNTEFRIKAKVDEIIDNLC